MAGTHTTVNAPVHDRLALYSKGPEMRGPVHPVLGLRASTLRNNGGQ